MWYASDSGRPCFIRAPATCSIYGGAIRPGWPHSPPPGLPCGSGTVEAMGVSAVRRWASRSLRPSAAIRLPVAVHRRLRLLRLEGAKRPRLSWLLRRLLRVRLHATRAAHTASALADDLLQA